MFWVTSSKKQTGWFDTSPMPHWHVHMFRCNSYALTLSKYAATIVCSSSTCLVGLKLRWVFDHTKTGLNRWILGHIIKLVKLWAVAKLCVSGTDSFIITTLCEVLSRKEWLLPQYIITLKVVRGVGNHWQTLGDCLLDIGTQTHHDSVYMCSQFVVLSSSLASRSACQSSNSVRWVINHSGRPTKWKTKGL